MFLIGASFLFYSCVDDTYDLKKDIDTDVEIKGNKLAFPLGTLRPFMLDSLVNDTEIVETMEDGVYCIKKTDVVQTEKDIEPITISIPRKASPRRWPSTIHWLWEVTPELRFPPYH